MAVPGKGYAPGTHVIEAYGKGGFRFGGLSHVGSILLLPSGVHAWPVSSPRQITVASMAPVIAEAAAIELLLIGVGADICHLAPDVRLALGEAGVRYEVMQTAAAARTCNVLQQEGRRVAAALIAVD